MRLHRGGRRDVGAERITQPADGARVQLRHARFVDAKLRANLLHRDFAVVVEARSRGARVPAAFESRPRTRSLTSLRSYARSGPLRLRRHEHGGQLRFVDVLAARERRGGFDGVDADDGLAEALLVGADRGGEVGQRRLVPELLRSRSRAASSSRRTRRTPRGHASLRSASIIAPRMRRSAKVSNLMPRAFVEALRPRRSRPMHAILHEIARGRSNAASSRPCAAPAPRQREAPLRPRPVCRCATLARLISHCLPHCARD